jgi:hypothetical protein
MSSKKIVAQISVAFIVLFFCMHLVSFGTQEKAGVDTKPERIIRLDLLKPKKREMSLPVINIFTGQRDENLSVSEHRGIPITNRPTGDLSQGIDVSVNEGEERNPGIQDFNLKYLGYVASLEKKVALILYNGEFLAVERGTVLPGGIEIIEITSTTVTVKGSGSEKRVLKLEGEEK